MTSARVLMLDFDGVLHPAQGADAPEFGRVEILERAMGDSQCDIVISSTWRKHFSLDQLCGRLGASLGPRVVDLLGPDLRGPFVRHKNILAWLQGNRWCADWRALDDTASEFPPGCKSLILCDGRVGTDAAQVLAVQHWLALQRS